MWLLQQTGGRTLWNTTHCFRYTSVNFENVFSADVFQIWNIAKWNNYLHLKLHSLFLSNWKAIKKIALYTYGGGYCLFHLLNHWALNRKRLVVVSKLQPENSKTTNLVRGSRVLRINFGFNFANRGFAQWYRTFFDLNGGLWTSY